MTEIITKNLIQSWSPRPLNRGEPFGLQHYEIFYAKDKAKVVLHLLVKGGEIIKRSDQIHHGDKFLLKTGNGSFYANKNDQ